MKLRDALAETTTLFLDTAPVIYHVEGHSAFQPLTDVVFEQIALGAITAVTSSITLAECLVHPYRDDNLDLIDESRQALLHGKNVQYVGVDAVIERSAELRARHNLSLPDALQFAAAIAAGCDGFLTNDLALKRITELRVLVLCELEP